MIVTRYSSNPMQLPIQDDELKDIIAEFVANVTRSSFTYLQLCDYIIEKCSAELSDRGQRQVIYLNKKLYPSDYSRISKVLWEFIWDRMICVDFFDNPYQPKRKEDTVFLICRKDDK